MGKYSEGDIINGDKYKVKEIELKDESPRDIRKNEYLRIVEVPDEGRPIAVIERLDEEMESKNHLLNRRL